MKNDESKKDKESIKYDPYKCHCGATYEYDCPDYINFGTVLSEDDFKKYKCHKCGSSKTIDE